MSPERKSGGVSLEEIVSHAKEIMFRDGNHVPALIVEGDKKLIITSIPDFPETHGEKIALLSFLGQACVQTGEIGKLQQAFLITEAWMSIPQDERLSDQRLSTDPKRKEVLSISGLQISERKKHLILFEVTRDDNQHVIKLEKFSPPHSPNEISIEIPLLEAFAKGFQKAFSAKYN